MTAPGSGGNNVNLAALWVPVMPETSHMGEGMRKAGAEARQEFESGFGSGGSTIQLGQNLGKQLSEGFKTGMGKLELPAGMSNVTEGMMRGFEGMSTRSENAREALTKLKESEEQLVNSHYRVAVAQSHMNDLQQRGVTSGTQYLSASGALVGAKHREEAALRSNSEAHEGYQEALASSRGGMLAFASETGLIAGSIAAAVPMIGSLIEGILDFWKEAAEKGVEVSVEFAKHLMEIGHEYHHLGIQIQQFSSASGESLEELETVAQRVFSSLDVAGGETGRTVALLSSRLHTMDAEALTPLVRHVEELHGRFNDLNPTDVATAFAALRVDIGSADTVLASWLASARRAGVDTGQLVEGLARVGEMLRPEITGLSAEQLGEWVAQMQAVVPNISRTVTALNSAQKEFVAHNMTFKEGIKEAIKELQAATTEADKEALAEKLFGTRRWAVALDMASKYADILAKGPDAFRASGSEIDEFTKRTQTLGNKWEEVKKKIDLALLPLAEVLVSHVSSGLDRLNNYVHTHSEQISKWVKNIGDSFIRLLPTLQQWTVDFLEILKPVAQGIEAWGSVLLKEIGLISGGLATMMDAMPKAMRYLPGFESSRKAAHDLSKTAFDMSNKMSEAVDPTGRFFDTIIGKVQGLHIDVPRLTTEFDNLSDSLGRKLGGAADRGINTVHVPGAPSTNPFAPSGGEPAAPGGPPELPGGAPGVGGAPAAPALPGEPGGPAGARPSAVQTPAQHGVYRAMVEAGFPNSWAAIANIVAGEDASWDVTAQNNIDINAKQGNPSRGIGQLTLSNYRAAGVDPYTNDAYLQGKAMMSYIKGRYGTPEAAWQHWQISHNYAGGGEVEVIPVADPHNVPAPHLPIYHTPGHGTRGHYDSPDMSPDAPILKYPGSHRVPQGPYEAAYGWEVQGGNGGIDDVPAWLTAGEFVMNKKATSKWRNVLRWMNAQAFDDGSTNPVAPGGQGSANAYAAHPNSNDIAGVDQEIVGVTYIANKLGLRLTAGRSGHGTHDIDKGHHDSGEAGDFSNGVQTPEELAFAQYMIQNFASEMAEIIHDSPALPQLVKDGKLYPKSIYAKDLPGHRDHVHVAFRPGSSKRLEDLAAATGQGAGATASAVAPGSIAFPAGMGAGGAGVPGMPGGPSTGPGGPSIGPPGTVAPPVGSPASTAGYGPFGTESYDQWYQGNKAITGAQQRLDDLGRQIGDKQKQLDKVNADLTTLQGKPKLLQSDQEIQSKTAERDRLQEELNQLRGRDVPGATDALTEAQRKAWEEAQKMPGGQQEYKIPGVSEFTQLGGGLVKGFSQALGFGDIFAKPPWEWGIVKLMSGLANWGLGTANTWAEEIGKGHTGMTGFRPVAGMEQSGSAGLEGVLKGFGLNVPMPKPQMLDRFGRPVGNAGPVAAGPMPGMPGSPGPGNGPIVQGDWMPINVSPNVNPSAILGPVQAQRNADNANLHTYTGGMPPP